MLGDKSHVELVSFLKEIASTLEKPSAIILISAHWEEDVVTITSGKSPGLFYDYYGFPQEAYQIKYPAPGNPTLADKIYHILQENGIKTQLDEKRGFDHGLFVPLKIMFPEANIPCVQISLLKNLDPQAHIDIGKALSGLRKEHVLIIGSGFTFHNMRGFFTPGPESTDLKNEAFEDWLIDTCTNGDLSPEERETLLIHWSEAPSARYCHPREEHLLPLHVCYGFSGTPATLVFDGQVTGKKVSSFLW